MTVTQKALLGLLKEIDDICRRNDIEYYLGGGTFIGAVRHGGFLPWDDDADIHMSKDNAAKFVEAVKKENRQDRVLYTGSNTGSNTLVHWRYENANSTVIMRHLVGTTDPKGQFVDIFVNYPLATGKKKWRQVDYYWLYCELKNSNFAGISTRSKAFLRKYTFFIKLSKIFGRNTILNYLDKKAYGLSDSENTTEWLIRSPINPKPVVLKSLWGHPKYLPFEDTMLPVAEHAEELLCYSYGPQWFEVPAYEERGSHVFVTDEDIPYSVHDKDWNAHFDTKHFYEEENRKKEYWFMLLQSRNLANPQVQKLKGLCVSLEQQTIIESSGLNMNDLLRDGCEKEVDSIFRPYMSMVNSSPVKYWNLYIDMLDEYLYTALYFSCFNGNYGTARRVLQQRRTCIERELSPELRRLCDLCDATDALLEARYAKLDMEKTRELVDEWLEKEPTTLYFQRADMDLRLSYD